MRADETPAKRERIERLRGVAPGVRGRHEHGAVRAAGHHDAPREVGGDAERRGETFRRGVSERFL